MPLRSLSVAVSLESQTEEVRPQYRSAPVSKPVSLCTRTPALTSSTKSGNTYKLPFRSASVQPFMLTREPTFWMMTISPDEEGGESARRIAVIRRIGDGEATIVAPTVG